LAHDLLKVEGVPGLVKSQSRNCIINTNSSELKQAKIAKQRILDEIESRKKIEDRLSNLESIMASLIEDKG